jgi:hypothetical protein
VTVPVAAAAHWDFMFWGPSRSTAQIIFDVTGYFTAGLAGGTYHKIAPARVLDTRTSLGGTPLHAQIKQTVHVVDPSLNAVAVTGNVTITGQTAGGVVSVAPSLASGLAPRTSTVNFPAADTRANKVTVSVTSGGASTSCTGRRPGRQPRSFST